MSIQVSALIGIAMITYMVIGNVSSMPSGAPITTTTNSPSTITTTTQCLSATSTIISDSILEELRNRLQFARGQAENVFVFNIICPGMVPARLCPGLNASALTNNRYPTFAIHPTVDSNCHLQNLVSAVFEVLYKYTKMTEQFVQSLAQTQTTYFGSGSPVNSALKRLQNREFYALVYLFEQMPDMAIPSSIPNISNTGDITRDNQQNVGIVARTASEVARMIASVNWAMADLASSSSSSSITSTPTLSSTTAVDGN